MSVQLIAVLTNIGLALMKFVVGTLAGSQALIADGFNSAGDIVATFVAWLAFRYGAQPPDEDHHYGHGNAEALAGLLIGAVICATGAFILVDGLQSSFESGARVAPERIALLAAAVTIVVKETLYRASMRVGLATRSPTLLASARDHRADVLSGAVALVGIGIAQFGWPAFDSIAGAVIGVYIFWLGIAPVRTNMGILMHEAEPRLAWSAEQVAREVSGVRGVGPIRVQPLGGSYRMDMTLRVAGDLSVAAAHEIAHRVERQVLARDASLIEVFVHVEPDDEGGGEA